MSDQNEPDCAACLAAVARVETSCSASNARIETTLKSLNNNFMKMFFALLGIIAANVTTKYIGTPIYVYAAVYLAVVSAVFVLLITIFKWRCLTFWEIWIRLSFVTMVAYASTLRIYHYQTATRLTQTEGIFANLLYATLAFGFIVLAWKRDAARRLNKRRYDD